VRIFRHDRALGPDRGAVVAIGNFDGVHPGHLAVIAEAGAVARRLRAPHAVLTFEPHPVAVFKPDAPPFRLTPLRAKARLIEQAGVDLFFAIHFDLAFAKKTAEQFIDEVLVEGLGSRHVVVGYDFIFGHRRRGNAAMLQAAGAAKGFSVSVMAPVAGVGDTVYASTSIREALIAGRPQDAAALLGRWWEIDGRVEHGEGVARGLGSASANLALEDYLRPAPGIYAAFAGIESQGKTAWHPAVAYLGRRPTLDPGALRLEAHLLDFAGDLYGKHLRVALVAYLRPDAALDGKAALAAQIARDVAAARAVLAGQKPPAG
jgi:riboflavin kinase/FMN adenylyltransferase